MMNKVSRQHIDKFLASGLRLDGRKPLEYRDVKIEYGVTKTAEGSAKVTLGETIVIAGVKLQIEKPYPDTPDQGSLMVSAELLPLSNPDYEPGPPNINSIELARVTDRGIRESGTIDVKKLCIEPGEKIWMVMVDLMPINDAGNLKDACSLAALAALQNAKFPKVVDGKVDYSELTDVSLPINSKTLSCTVLKIGDHFIVDPSLDEEKVYDARLTVATNENGEICALQKGGEKGLTKDEILEVAKIAKDSTAHLRQYLG